jgi:hypothetical protein
MFASWIKRKVVFLLAVLGMAVVLASPVWAEDDPYQGLPEGPGRDTVLGNCTVCHNASIILQNAMSRKKWDELITWMQEKQGMWELDAGTRNTILDYLAKFRGLDATGKGAPRAGKNPMYQYDYPPNPL